MEQIALDFFLPSCGICVTEKEEDDKDVADYYSRLHTIEKGDRSLESPRL
jgi:hypothetical protein